ncbi:MAG: glycosyltransferase family 2 protein, partial [Ruminococcus sp.]|nr:glycosyltransferase family 2 protein [Ruminococcus sp.]
MKYISFAIPCYNSESYMENAINSILKAGEDVEILVVNDGSKDRTQEIGEQYAKMYPTIVKVINKENGGHGDAVNHGLHHATGKYFKVVDSDDWVDEEALMKIMETVKKFVDEDNGPDMIVANYVYEKEGAAHKKVIRYTNVLPEEQILKWDEIGKFHIDQYILMHSVIYRTEL